ncbi:hypothetical protein BDB00DRAFT_956321, partial [Zychaea mexicana]|uniref:uncharacterized protein n=1 Tax=Zychaea mexicana TaxID=64656 RepID=UPI0022FED51E
KKKKRHKKAGSEGCGWRNKVAVPKRISLFFSTLHLFSFFLAYPSHNTIKTKHASAHCLGNPGSF